MSLESELTIPSDFIEKARRLIVENLNIRLCKYVREIFPSSEGEIREVAIAQGDKHKFNFKVVADILQYLQG